MNFPLVFWLLFALMLFIVLYCDRKYNLLRNDTPGSPKPYSWARVQLAWWTIIVITSFATIVICSDGHMLPTLDASTLLLIGITTGTTAVARLIDVSDQKNPQITAATMVQAQKNPNFFLDILSDGNGVSMHRMQTVIFNVIFGGWFIAYVLEHCTPDTACNNYQSVQDALHTVASTCNKAQWWNSVMPIISSNNLILLGLSSATYAALKSTENMTAPKTAPGVVQGQGGGDGGNGGNAGGNAGDAGNAAGGNAGGAGAAGGVGNVAGGNAGA